MILSYRNFRAKVTSVDGKAKIQLLNGFPNKYWLTVDDPVSYFHQKVDELIDICNSTQVSLQDVLRDINRKKLVKTYIANYVNEKDLALVGKKKIKKKLKQYLKWLLKQQVESSDLIAFVSHSAKSTYLLSPVPEFNVQCLGNLGNINARLGLEFTSVERVLGMRIIMTSKTKMYLYSLVANFLYIMTWTGWHQENLQNEVDRLTQDLDFDESDCISKDEFFKELGYRRDKVDHFDRFEYQTSREALRLQADIVKHSFNKETRKVRKLLVQEISEKQEG